MALVWKVDDALPVMDVMKPILMVFTVTPGALAVLPAPALEVLDDWPAAEVGVVAAFLDELPHAVATNATATSMMPALRRARRDVRIDRSPLY
jgi:hypothetical protein